MLTYQYAKSYFLPCENILINVLAIFLPKGCREIL